MKLRAVRLARRALRVAVLAIDALDAALEPYDVGAEEPAPEMPLVHCLACGVRGPEWICDGCATVEHEVRA